MRRLPNFLRLGVSGAQVGKYFNIVAAVFERPEFSGGAVKGIGLSSKNSQSSVIKSVLFSESCSKFNTLTFSGPNSST